MWYRIAVMRQCAAFLRRIHRFVIETVLFPQHGFDVCLYPVPYVAQFVPHAKARGSFEFVTQFLDLTCRPFHTGLNGCGEAGALVLYPYCIMRVECTLRVIVIAVSLTYIIHSATIGYFLFHHFGSGPNDVRRGVWVDVNFLCENTRSPPFNLQ